MNLLKIQDQLKGLPDDALISYVQNPNGQVPTYLALSELERRKSMRDEYQAEQAQAPQSTVAQDLTQPTGGLAAMMQQGQMQAPQQPQQPQMMAQAPQPQPPVQMAEGGLAGLDVGDMFNEQNYATGGMVAFDEGGEVPGYAEGVYIPPTDYDPTQEYRDARQYAIDKAMAEKYAPSSTSVFGGNDLLDLVNEQRKQREAAEKAGVISPYDAAIKYYGADSSAGQTLQKRRAAWIAGLPDPFTGAQPIGSVKNIRGEGEPGGRPTIKQEAMPKKEESKPVVAPRVDIATEKTLFPEQPSKNLSDYAQELKDFLGEDTSRSAAIARAQKREEELNKQKDISPWMALAEAGFNIAAGQSPYALSNIGAGATQGLKSYAATQKDLATQQDKLDALQYDIASAERKEQFAMAKFGADSKQAYEERVAKEKLLDKEMAARYKIAQLQEAGDDRRALLGLAAKGAEKQPTLSDKIKLQQYLDEQMPAIKERAMQGLGSNADKPGSRNYNEYLRRIEDERRKIIQSVGGGTSSSSTYIYDPQTGQLGK